MKMHNLLRARFEQSTFRGGGGKGHNRGNLPRITGNQHKRNCRHRQEGNKPGKPAGNAFMESCNGHVRDECLNMHQFASLAEAQTIIDWWRLDYNQRRPHSSLGHLPPYEFVGQRQVIQAAVD